MTAMALISASVDAPDFAPRASDTARETFVACARVLVAAPSVG